MTVPHHRRPVQRRSSLFPISHSVHRRPPTLIASCLPPTPSYSHASPPFLAVLFHFGIHSLYCRSHSQVEPTVSLPRSLRYTWHHFMCAPSPRSVVSVCLTFSVHLAPTELSKPSSHRPWSCNELFSHSLSALLSYCTSQNCGDPSGFSASLQRRSSSRNGKMGFP
jgi:hypothetical protein